MRVHKNVWALFFAIRSISKWMLLFNCDHCIRTRNVNSNWNATEVIEWYRYLHWFGRLTRSYRLSLWPINLEQSSSRMTENRLSQTQIITHIIVSIWNAQHVGTVRWSIHFVTHKTNIWKNIQKIYRSLVVNRFNLSSLEQKKLKIWFHKF